MSDNGITVNKLLKLCKEQVKKGNGDKIVLLSDDDEGNGFHTLYCGFTDDEKDIEEYSDSFHDGNDPSEVIILG